MPDAPCLCLPLVLTPSLSTGFLEEIDDAEGPDCSAGRGKKAGMDEEEPGGEPGWRNEAIQAQKGTEAERSGIAS